LAKKKVKKQSPTFEQSLAELEEIVAKLEGGQLGLADSLDQYERGVRHLKSCYRLLSDAERRIELVRGLDASGEPQTEPFDDESNDESDDESDESLDDKSAARSRRRSSATGAKKVKRRPPNEVDDSGSLF